MSNHPLKTIKSATAILLLVGSSLSQAQETPNLVPEVTKPVVDRNVVAGTSWSLDLNGVFSDPDVESAVTINTVFGRIYSALYATEMPVTVKNFLGYVEQTHPSGGGYTGQGASGAGETFFHRSPGTGFVIQTGGFYVETSGVNSIVTDAPIALETSATGPKNLRGTLAMARTTSPDSATSGFYINTSDNNSLDYVNAESPGYAVFGRVLGSGMDIVDRIDKLPNARLDSPFTDLPVNDINGNQTIDLPGDLATISEVLVISPLAYTISVDDPTLVSHTLLEGGNVRFDFAAGRSGTATVTLTATDLEGASIKHRFRINVSAPDIDTDGDGDPDTTDLDDDNDGTPDTKDAFPLNKNESKDSDGDGIGDNADPDDDNDGTPDTREIKYPGDPATPPATNPSNVVAAAAGKYAGFLSSADGERVLGYFKKIKVAATGKFSAKMFFGNASYSIKGVLANGQYSGVVTPKAGGPATVDLQLVRTGKGAYKIEGTVKVGSQTANIQAVKAGGTRAQAGAYTLLVPEEKSATAPKGNGYGLMTVTTLGTAKVKGVLGDGSKWTAKCLITADGEMPLYSGKAGVLGGLVRFRNQAGVSDCDAEVHWRGPGFNLQRHLIGSRFRASGVLPSGRLISNLSNASPNVEAYVGAGSGAAANSWGFLWTAANKIEYAGPEKIKLKVSTKNGQIKGKLPQGNTKFKLEGVVFQKQRLAAGMVYVKGGKPRSLVIVPVE